MTKYQNARLILPTDLLEALQTYAAGQHVYVPQRERRLGWGSRSGAREAIDERNHNIRLRRSSGASIDEIAAEFHLSHDSVRKIVRGKNECSNSRD